MYGTIGRIGGDEFAVLIDKPMSLPEMKESLDKFLTNIINILPTPQKVTCSIGVCQFTYPQNMSMIYAETDKILYAAKKRGRACYLVGIYNGSLQMIPDPATDTDTL